MKRNTLAIAVPTCCLALALARGGAPVYGQGEGGDPHVGLEMSGDGIAVKVGGKLFTVYRFNVEGTPILFPVMGPHGEHMTRQFPMVEGVEGEMTDHPHHRAVWFTHRDVNGHNFWGVSEGHAIIKHRKVRQMESGGGGKPAVIVVENDWVTAGGEAVCSDERELRIRGLGRGEVLLDYRVKVIADQGIDVVFGEEKDGGMAIRVAPWMRLEDRKGNRGTGAIINSEGHEGREAWGKRARWIDYHGTAPDGKTYGVAMFDHPANLRHPTWWHARYYGLLSANPFGQGVFEEGEAPVGSGSYTIGKGDDLELRYRFFLHRGDHEKARVAARYEEFTAEGE